MSMIEEFAEFFAGTVLLIASAILIFSQVTDPAYEQIEINYNARADKAISYSFSFNDGAEIRDQKVGRLPGLDPADHNTYNSNDSGMSRRYFRPEQFIMLPAVDTDVSSNIATIVNQRYIFSAPNFTEEDTLGTKGLIIGSAPNTMNMPYTITMDSLSNKQITYDSMNTTGKLNYLRSKIRYGSPNFGSQVNGSSQIYGGFNITVESGIHPLSKKKGNTIIFVEGRVPSK